MSYVIGIDTSTTATKAVLVAADGTVTGVAASHYRFETPRDLWSEQDPELWWQATIEAIRSVVIAAGIDPSSVHGIGMTGQMHGLVLLGSDDEPLRPAILWNDQRTGAECDEIRSTVGADHLIDITGNDALAGFTAPKILWVRNHEPDIFRAARHVLLPKDFVRLRLTGEYASDRAGGSGTILFDIRRRTWSEELLSSLDLDRTWFPPTFEGPAVTGRLTPEAAAVTGLRVGTPVMAGGGDQAANAVGVGAATHRTGALSLGTSGVVFVNTERPIIDPAARLHSFCHAVPDQWHLMGVMLSAAGSLQWFHDSLAPGDELGALVESAGQIPAGADGLLFLPYLTGERTPHADPHARGAFVGLTVRHSRTHMLRAVLEGVAFGLRDSLDLVGESGVAIDELRISGGGTKSQLWRQILADVLDTDLVSTSTVEGAAYGAAILAGVGAGLQADVASATDQWVTETQRTVPSDRAGAYRDLHGAYRGLYPALRDTFRTLA